MTMKDVARSAGVSVATVSRVLAGRERVAAPKRAAVERACKQLGYQRDGLAAALRSRSSSSIGILVPDITNPIFPAVIRAAEHELSTAALDLILCDADNNVKLEAQRLDTLLRRRVDAVLVCPVDAHLSTRSLRRASKSMRVVQLFRSAVDDADFLGIDQTAGMSQIVDHLLDQGTNDAVFLGLHQGMSSLTDRARAFEAACDRAGLKAWPTIEVGFPDVAHGREHIRELISRNEVPDAIVCASDELAFGVLAELRSVGIHSPNQVLVTGFDDTPAAELIGLTSVRQPLQELGREAARLLQQESGAVRHVRLTPTLVHRTSTMPAASST